MCSPNFDTYQVTVAPNCFKSHTQTLDLLLLFKKKKNGCLMSGLKFTLSDVKSFQPDKLPALKKIIFSPAWSVSIEGGVQRIILPYVL